MTPLTPRQAECLTAIRRYTAEHGCGPSLADLAGALGIKQRGAVHNLLIGLRRRGHVTWTPRASRSIEIIEPERIALPAALMARLAAHCAATGDRPADVLQDAVALHLDAVDATDRDEVHG